MAHIHTMSQDQPDKEVNQLPAAGPPARGRAADTVDLPDLPRGSTPGPTSLEHLHHRENRPAVSLANSQVDYRHMEHYANGEVLHNVLRRGSNHGLSSGILGDQTIHR